MKFIIFILLFGFFINENLCNEESDTSKPETNGFEKRPGQCPYIFHGEQSCNFQCKSDSSCPKTEKCCSNGCGTECMKSSNLTTCQHQRIVAKYNKQHYTVSNGYIPKCTEAGKFEKLQCDPAKNECWCVDFRGFEISQTRTPSDQLLNCSTKSYSGNCPLYKCKNCDHGFEIDKDGCRTCRCTDPCSSVRCTELDESCRLANVQCSGWSCPPIPMCLLSTDNPCLFGTPLTKKDNSLVICSADQLCPATHMCTLRVFAAHALCCPRPQIQKGCPDAPCNLFCPHGFSYDKKDCPLCRCHEPCKNVQCPESTICKVKRVTCCRAPCLPIASCE